MNVTGNRPRTEPFRSPYTNSRQPIPEGQAVTSRSSRLSARSAPAVPPLGGRD